MDLVELVFIPSESDDDLIDFRNAPRFALTLERRKPLRGSTVFYLVNPFSIQWQDLLHVSPQTTHRFCEFSLLKFRILWITVQTTQILSSCLNTKWYAFFLVEFFANLKLLLPDHCKSTFDGTDEHAPCILYDVRQRSFLYHPNKKHIFSNMFTCTLTMNIIRVSRSILM